MDNTDLPQLLSGIDVDKKRMSEGVSRTSQNLYNLGELLHQSLHNFKCQMFTNQQ